MHTVYILYSVRLDRYYTGYTAGDLAVRLQKHLRNHSGYTSQTNGWIVVYSQREPTKSDGLKLEKRIKKRGAKRFLEDQK